LLGTSTSIKSGRVELVLWAQILPLSEIKIIERFGREDSNIAGDCTDKNKNMYLVP
jgi:hypothetical protein